MDSASTAKQRHINRCKYRPMFNDKRDSRVIAANGANQTFKHTGDFVMGAFGTKEVSNHGWH